MAIDVRRPLKKILPHLLQAQADTLNEADTVQRLIKVFEDVFGYDPMSEITRESAVKDRYCDVALKLDGVIRMLVEAKSGGTVLRHKHIEQAQNYAANSNIKWVILTNGVTWNLYHLTFDEGIESTLAFSVDMTNGVDDKQAELLGLLHRQALRKGELDEYWDERVALSPSSIGRALFTDTTLRVIRREIRRREKILINEEDLAAAIHEMFSTEARERIGPLKIRRARRPKANGGEPAGRRSDDAPVPEVAPAGGQEKKADS
jgi:predicted type IV restriction endonuclease